MIKISNGSILEVTNMTTGLTQFVNVNQFVSVPVMHQVSPIVQHIDRLPNLGTLYRHIACKADGFEVLHDTLPLSSVYNFYVTSENDVMNVYIAKPDNQAMSVLYKVGGNVHIPNNTPLFDFRHPLMNNIDASQSPVILGDYSVNIYNGYNLDFADSAVYNADGKLLLLTGGRSTHLVNVERPRNLKAALLSRFLLTNDFEFVDESVMATVTTIDRLVRMISQSGKFDFNSVSKVTVSADDISVTRRETVTLVKSSYGVQSIFDDTSITPLSCVFGSFSRLIDYWNSEDLHDVEYFNIGSNQVTRLADAYAGRISMYEQKLSSRLLTELKGILTNVRQSFIVITGKTITLDIKDDWLNADHSHGISRAIYNYMAAMRESGDKLSVKIYTTKSFINQFNASNYQDIGKFAKYCTLADQEGSPVLHDEGADRVTNQLLRDYCDEAVSNIILKMYGSYDAELRYKLSDTDTPKANEVLVPQQYTSNRNRGAKVLHYSSAGRKYELASSLNLVYSQRKVTPSVKSDGKSGADPEDTRVDSVGFFGRNRLDANNFNIHNIDINLTFSYDANIGLICTPECKIDFYATPFNYVLSDTGASEVKDYIVNGCGGAVNEVYALTRKMISDVHSVLFSSGLTLTNHGIADWSVLPARMQFAIAEDLSPSTELITRYKLANGGISKSFFYDPALYASSSVGSNNGSGNRLHSRSVCCVRGTDVPARPYIFYPAAYSCSVNIKYPSLACNNVFLTSNSIEVQDTVEHVTHTEAVKLATLWLVEQFKSYISTDDLSKATFNDLNLIYCHRLDDGSLIDKRLSDFINNFTVFEDDLITALRAVSGSEVDNALLTEDVKDRILDIIRMVLDTSGLNIKIKHFTGLNVTNAGQPQGANSYLSFLNGR